MSAQSLHHGVAVGQRDPAHALYDHACDLLVAAQGLRSMAGTEGTGPAVAATFGCLEATLDALADSIARLSGHAVTLVTTSQHRSIGHGQVASGRVAYQCTEVVRLLRLAQEVTGEIRERVGPVLAEIDA
jgi:hypothetical protein